MANVPRQSYDDGQVQLDRFALTLRRYHFPSGTAKVIPVRAIKGYRTESLGLLTHRFRIWGTSDLRRWLPLDVHRPMRSVLVTVDVGSWPSPAFPPEDPKRFLTMLDELLKATGGPQGSQTS